MTLTLTNLGLVVLTLVAALASVLALRRLRGVMASAGGSTDADQIAPPPRDHRAEQNAAQ